MSTLVNPYCTETQLRAYLRNQDASIADVVKEAINQASRWIDEYKGRDYFEHDYTATGLVIDDWDELTTREILFLGYNPLIQLVSLTVGGTVWNPETQPGVLTDPPADYRVKPDKGEVISFRGTWLPDRRQAQVLVHTGAIAQISQNLSLQLRGAPEQVVVAKARFGYEQRSSAKLSTAVSVTVNATTDTVTETGHSRNAGDPVVLAGVALPTGFSADKVYYVVNPATDTYQLSATIGGDVVDATSTGTSVTVAKALLDSSLVPTGCPDWITRACIEIAATFTKWNQKDVVALDGSRQAIVQTEIPKSALTVLGARAKVMV